MATDVTAAPASDAEALSCALAGRYAGRWAQSVARPASGDDEGAEPAAPWFIDGFAGADLQRAALRGLTIRPTALAAVQALDEATAGRARIVLIDEDPGLIARLGDEMESLGAGDRIRIATDPASAQPGEILLVEASFASHAQRLANRIGEEAALVRLAPLAARSLPWGALQPIAHLAFADVLLRFPREDFEKQARFTGPLADLPPHLRRVVEGCSAFLDDARHGWLLPWRQAQRAAGPDAALATVVERMQALLAASGDERFTHALRVEGKGDPVHLLLSTPRAGHPLELDGALVEAGTRQKPPAKRKSAASATVTVELPVVEAPFASAVEVPTPAAEEPFAPDPPVEESAASDLPAVDQPAASAPSTASEEPAADEQPATPLDVFALAPQAEPEPRGRDLAAFADALHTRHSGARVPVREVLAGAADSGLAPEQVRAALASLKRAGRVSYRSLDAEGAEVEFLAEARPSAPRTRKPRAPAPGVLGLFDEPEE
jgi:hypothetical protein